MDIVLRESERLNTTIRSFLAYARPQRFAIARARRSPGRATTPRSLLRNSADVREDHVVEVDVPPIELWCEADENQIRQIVWNLATNGLRAMPHGGRLLLSGADRDSAAGRRRPARSRTKAAALPPDELDSLFQPFRGSFDKGQRSRPRDRPPHRHRLQRRDSGELDSRGRTAPTVSVRSAGARSGGVDRMTLREPPTTAAPDRADRRPPRILVVDDEPSMREMLRIVLRRDGYEVLVAENGRAAIDVAASASRSTCCSRTSRCRTSAASRCCARPRRSTGHRRLHDDGVRLDEHRRRGDAPRRVDYFTKPFNIDDLQLKVRQHLENRRLKQENVLLKRTLEPRTSSRTSSAAARRCSTCSRWSKRSRGRTARS